MKDYTMDKNIRDSFILNYKRINNTLVVSFANGDKWAVADTSENESKLLDAMKEQVTHFSTIKEKSTTTRVLLSKGSIILCIGAGALIGKMIDDPTICYTALSLVALGTTIPIVKIAKGQSIINDIYKQRFIQGNSDEINESIQIPTLLTGISPKAKKLIETRIAEGQQPFNLNVADDLSLEEVKKIIQNLRINKEYGFTYPEKEKQKVK